MHVKQCLGPGTGAIGQGSVMGNSLVVSGSKKKKKNSVMGIRVDGEGLGQITRVFSVTQYTHIKSFTQKKVSQNYV